MSYNVVVTLPSVPSSNPEAWAALDEMIDAKGPVPPVFDTLLSNLTNRFPCITELPDEQADDGVWSDGPLRDNLGHRASVLGMVYSRVEEVRPFLIRQANALGLVVFDWATGIIHRPPAESDG